MSGHVDCAVPRRTCWLQRPHPTHHWWGRATARSPKRRYCCRVVES